MFKAKWGKILFIVFTFGMLINLPGSLFAAGDGEIRIGVAGPHTGFAAAFGDDMYNGVELRIGIKAIRRAAGRSVCKIVQD